MKKHLLFICALGMATGLLAQTPFQLQKQDPNFGQIKLVKPLPMIEYAAVYQESNPFVSVNRDAEEWIGLTRYDLQSNYSMAQRIFLHPDNTIGATFTWGMDDPGFAARGTGYNYHDGSSWGPLPTGPIESVRAGWPSYAPYGENGEVVVSHFFRPLIAILSYPYAKLKVLATGWKTH